MKVDSLLSFLTMTYLFDIISDRTINFFMGNNDHLHPEVYNYIKYPFQEVRLNLEDIPPVDDGTTRIVIVSDTHERHAKLLIPKADALIHCGDIFMLSRYFSLQTGIRKLEEFNCWLEKLPCKTKFVIGGNHDSVLEKLGCEKVQQILTNGVYLENNFGEIGNLRIWGSPASSGASGNKAFQSKSFCSQSLNEAPPNVDILLTHGHCPDLEEKVSHQIHIWGHSHNSYGIRRPPDMLKGHPVRSLSICAPIMDRRFQPSHLPVVLDISTNSLASQPPVTIKSEQGRKSDSKSNIVRLKSSRIIPL